MFILTLCLLGNFAAFLLSAEFFFKINFFDKFFQEYHQSVKQYGSSSDPTFCGPDFGPNCLQSLSADDTSRGRVKSTEFFRYEH